MTYHTSREPNPNTVAASVPVSMHRRWQTVQGDRTMWVTETAGGLFAASLVWGYNSHSLRILMPCGTCISVDLPGESIGDVMLEAENLLRDCGWTLRDDKWVPRDADMIALSERHALVSPTDCPDPALCGEAGETANKCKKHWRGDPGKTDAEWRDIILDELADVQNYVLLMASHLHADILTLARNKFLAVEARPEFKAVAAQHGVTIP